MRKRRYNPGHYNLVPASVAKVFSTYAGVGQSSAKGPWRPIASLLVKTVVQFSEFMISSVSVACFIAGVRTKLKVTVV